MFGNALSPKAGLSVALGGLWFLLASIAGPAVISAGPRAEASARQRFELIPTRRATELPAELRAQEGTPSIAEALGLPEASGTHTVQLHWVVRENRELAGYRVSLVAADGLPGHLGARWWVAPGQGTPVGDGLTAYSAEISLALDGEVPVAAAIEAVDASGHTVLLGTRRSSAAADPSSQRSLSARATALSAASSVLHFGPMAPSACEAGPASLLYPLPSDRLASAPSAAVARRLDQGGSVSERGPPVEGLTT